VAFRTGAVAVLAAAACLVDLVDSVDPVDPVDPVVLVDPMAEVRRAPDPDPALVIAVALESGSMLPLALR
jgi:hypothetical protein